MNIGSLLDSFLALPFWASTLILASSCLGMLLLRDACRLSASLYLRRRPAAHHCLMALFFFCFMVTAGSLLARLDWAITSRLLTAGLEFFFAVVIGGGSAALVHQMRRP